MAHNGHKLKGDRGCQLDHYGGEFKRRFVVYFQTKQKINGC
jgi:hypothetical protein